jgi:hypothetical protein
MGIADWDINGGQLVEHPVKDSGGTPAIIFAKVVYQFRPFPYAPFTPDRAEAMRGSMRGSMRGRDDMQLVRSAMVVPPLPPSARGLVVVIKRKGARSFSDHAGVMTAAQRAVDLHMAAQMAAHQEVGTSSEDGTKPVVAHLKVVEFGAPGTAKEDIAIFKRARVILAGHGAGVYNAVWAGKGTSVIEVCYTTGIPCPGMYATMVRQLDQQYFSLVASGDYGGQMKPGLGDIEEIVKLALQSADTHIN